MSRYCKHGAFQSDCNLCDPVGGSDLSAANCSAFIETTSEMTGEGFVSGVKFTVGVQSFMLAYEGSDEDAKWMATQLAIALRAGGMNVVLSSLIKPNVPAHPIEPPQKALETPTGEQVTDDSDSPERHDLGAAPCSAYFGVVDSAGKEVAGGLSVTKKSMPSHFTGHIIAQILKELWEGGYLSEELKASASPPTCSEEILMKTS